MPKIEIDYSNTIIYKITCKDSIVNDVYVGHTTNFVQRKHAHKQSCINDKSPNHNCKLYEVIRNNGGWNNWKMEIINFFNCQNHYEARKKEQEYFVSLNASLNSIEPMPKPKIKPIVVKEIKEKQIFYCEICDIHCDNSKLLEIHNNTKKHEKLSENKIKTNDNEIMPKLCFKYYCENCDYGTSKCSSYKNHCLSSKHIKTTQNNDIMPKLCQSYICKNCSKLYNSRNGLWKHKKTCTIIEKESNINTINYKNEISPELIMSVLQQNKELQQILIEQNKTIIELSKNNSINNNNKILKKIAKEVTIDKS